MCHWWQLKWQILGFHSGLSTTVSHECLFSLQFFNRRTLTVNDTNDRSPVFTQEIYSATISEVGYWNFLTSWEDTNKWWEGSMFLEDFRCFSLKVIFTSSGYLIVASALWPLTAWFLFFSWLIFALDSSHSCLTANGNFQQVSSNKTSSCLIVQTTQKSKFQPFFIEHYENGGNLHF